jgi:hypothetical protein
VEAQGENVVGWLVGRNRVSIGSPNLVGEAEEVDYDIEVALQVL